jgi:hypothetical protein
VSIIAFLSSQKEIAMGILAIIKLYYMRTTATPIRIFWMKLVIGFYYFA